MTDKIIKTKENIPEESSTIELEKVKFPRSWAFWESYTDKEKKKDYNNLMNKIFEWDNLIKFWQFWNQYPGNEASNIFFDGTRIIYFFKDKNRINAMNVFAQGIKPEWEDPNNAGGQYFQLDYRIDKDIDKFFKIVSGVWKTLILNTMGENMPCAEFVNFFTYIILI